MSTPICPWLVGVSSVPTWPHRTRVRALVPSSLGVQASTRSPRCPWAVVGWQSNLALSGGSGSPGRKLIVLLGRSAISHPVLVGFLLEPAAFPPHYWPWLSGPARAQGRISDTVLVLLFAPWHCLQNFRDPQPSMVLQTWRLTPLSPS